MRISDWSSDVCSSDLYHRNACRRCRRHAQVVLGHQGYGAVARADRYPFAPHPGREQPPLRGGGCTLFHCSYPQGGLPSQGVRRSEEHTSELQSLMRISYAVFCLKKKKKTREE